MEEVLGQELERVVLAVKSENGDGGNSSKHPSKC